MGTLNDELKKKWLGNTVPRPEKADSPKQIASSTTPVKTEPEGLDWKRGVTPIAAGKAADIPRSEQRSFFGLPNRARRNEVSNPAPAREVTTETKQTSHAASPPSSSSRGPIPAPEP